ncbi:MAG: hypothetical protein V4702_04920 [Patescibacteria group bacterium]
MKTVISVKTDVSTKLRAQSVAKQIGIPLSTLINAYLRDLASSGTVHFSAPEPMTPQMEKIIEQAERDIAAGDVSGPFKTSKELFDHLDNL